MKSIDLQNQINELDQLIQGGAADAQLNLWEMQRKELQDQLQAALENEQAHESRLQEAAAESSSFLCDIDIAGVPVAESGLSELAFKVLDSKVTAKHVAAVSKLSIAMNEQQTDFQIALKAALDRATNSEYTAEQMNILNNEQGVKIYQLELENTELDTKARKGAELLFEATETIEKLNKQIDDYKKAELLAPQPTITVSTSEQIAKQEAELKASRIKVTKMELSNPDDFNTRDWFVVLALTGEKIAINYLQKGLYTLISDSEAEQYRADEANKKAEKDAEDEALKDSIPVTQELQVDPVNKVVLEEEAPAEENSFPSDQIQTTDNGAVQSDVRNDTENTMVAESAKESEVVTRAEFNKRVGQLEIYVQQLNHRAGLLPDEQAVA